MPNMEFGFRGIVEGNDGTGKSTIADMLAWQTRKNGIETIRVDEPDSAIDAEGNILVPASRALRTLVKDGSYNHTPYADLQMFNIARFANWQLASLPVLERQGAVLQARDRDSSKVYQGHADGLGIDFVEEETRKTITDERYFNPDFKTILIFKNEIERQKRVRDRAVLETPDTFESRGQEFQDRLNEGYLIVAERDGTDLTEIEAGQSRNEIADIVYEKMIGKIGVSLVKYDWEEYWETKAA